MGAATGRPLMRYNRWGHGANPPCLRRGGAVSAAFSPLISYLVPMGGLEPPSGRSHGRFQDGCVCLFRHIGTNRSDGVVSASRAGYPICLIFCQVPPFPSPPMAVVAAQGLPNTNSCWRPSWPDPDADEGGRRAVAEPDIHRTQSRLPEVQR